MHIVDRVPDQVWDRFVAAHARGHILQTGLWGVHQAEFGWDVKRVVVQGPEGVVAGAQIFFRRLVAGWSRAYLPRGPLLDFAHLEAAQTLFAAIHRLCRARRAILLKVEPNLLVTQGAADLGRYGFRRSDHTVQPPRTILLDLGGSEDEILRRMKSKTRYNIRLAGRKGVQVRVGDRGDVAAFNRLLAVTTERDAFVAHSPAYYERVFELFAPRDMARLFLATYQGQTLAAIIVFVLGDKAWYIYGASSNEHRDKMPAYALQWAAIRWAKARGCTQYDLWGVPDQDEQTLEAHFTGRRDGLWGVYRFKRGFGGRLVRYAGAWDCIYNKPLYALYRLALRFKYAG